MFYVVLITGLEQFNRKLKKKSILYYFLKWKMYFFCIFFSCLSLRTLIQVQSCRMAHKQETTAA